MSVEAEAQLCPAAPALCVSPPFLFLYTNFFGTPAAEPMAGQGAEAGTVASVLQSGCHAASFLWVWYVIDVFNKWTFASRI